MRCYNGAWDDEATAMFKEQDALMAEIRVLEPNAHCTYFPAEQKFEVHAWGVPLSDFHSSKLEALRTALNRLKSC